MTLEEKLLIPVFKRPFTAQQYSKLVELTVRNLVFQRSQIRLRQNNNAHKLDRKVDWAAIRNTPGHMSNALKKEWENNENTIRMEAFLLKNEPFCLPAKENLLNISVNSWNLLRFRNYGHFDWCLFLESVPHIFETVSQKIFKHQYSSLNGLICPLLLSQIKHRFSKFGFGAKNYLNLTQTDLYSYFPAKDPNLHSGFNNLFANYFYGAYLLSATSRQYYTGPPVRLHKVFLRTERGKTYQDVWVVVTSVYKYSKLRNWPHIPHDYGYPLPVIVYANFCFSRIVEPDFEDDWIISDLNYIAV